VTHRTDITPPARRARSKDRAPEILLIKKLADERVRQLRNSVSELRAAQRRLAKSEAQVEERNRYRDLFQYAPDGYLVTDLHGKIVEANVAAARLLNIPESFLPGKPLTLYVHPEQRNDVFSRMAAIAPGETVEWNMDLLPRSSADARTVHATIAAELSEPPVRRNLRWLLRDVTDQSRRERALRADRQGLSTLATQLTLAQERERRRIATEIHDHIGQSLAFCQLRLGMLRQSLGPDELTVVDEVRALLAQVIQQTRSLTFELSPTVLYELGLGPAIEWLIDQRGHLGITFRLETMGQARRLDHSIEITLFEAVREVLSNVIKHSRASSTTVRLAYAPRAVSVEVQDDGVGFSPADASAMQTDRRSLGLLSVRERMDFLNGAVEIHSSPGRGTRVRLTVPLDATSHDRSANPKASKP
jgi:PAS domain S-box-containing protein